MSAKIVYLRNERKNTPPPRMRNIDRRPREHLFPDEVERLIKAARNVGRHKHRDSAMILIMFRHALRVSELVALKWSQFDFREGVVHVTRAKNGRDATHPLAGVEIRALRKLKREYNSPFVFSTSQAAPITTATVRRVVARAGKLAEIEFACHPHQLRHSCGYKLANQGVDTRSLQAWMGHRSISNTTRYTAMSSKRFDGFWSD